MAHCTGRPLIVATLAALALAGCAAQRPQRTATPPPEALAGTIQPGQLITYLDESGRRRWLEVEELDPPRARGTGWELDARGKRAGLGTVEVDLGTVDDVRVEPAPDPGEALEVLGMMLKVVVLVSAGLILAL